nr:DUF202 domain-containing protein [Streptomyces sp. SID161]
MRTGHPARRGPARVPLPGAAGPGGGGGGGRDGRGGAGRVGRVTAGTGPVVRDPGLQPERTRLAWRRTTLSAAVAAVLALRAALHGGLSTPGVVACAACCALWLGFLRVAHHRIRALAAGSPPAALAPRHATAAVTYAVALAVCAVVLVV